MNKHQGQLAININQFSFLYLKMLGFCQSKKDFDEKVLHLVVVQDQDAARTRRKLREEPFYNNGNIKKRGVTCQPKDFRKYIQYSFQSAFEYLGCIFEVADTICALDICCID